MGQQNTVNCGAFDDASHAPQLSLATITCMQVTQSWQSHQAMYTHKKTTAVQKKNWLSFLANLYVNIPTCTLVG